MGPGAREQWLHRDEVVWSDLPRIGHEIGLASVIALVDVTRDNGATPVVPGSHRWSDRQLPGAQQIAEPIPASQIGCAEMRAGSPVVYLGGTIHAGGGNATDTTRRGAHLSFCLGWLRTEENNYLAVPPSSARTLPRRARQVLGYAVHDGIARAGGYLGMVRGEDPCTFSNVAA